MKLRPRVFVHESEKLCLNRFFFFLCSFFSLRSFGENTIFMQACPPTAELKGLVIDLFGEKVVRLTLVLKRDSQFVTVVVRLYRGFTDGNDIAFIEREASPMELATLATAKRACTEEV